MPLGSLLVGVSHGDGIHLAGPVGATDLQTNWQSVFGEPARHSDGGQTVVVEGSCVTRFRITGSGIGRPDEFLFDTPCHVADGRREHAFHLLLVEHFIVDHSAQSAEISPLPDVVDGSPLIRPAATAAIGSTASAPSAIRRYARQFAGAQHFPEYGAFAATTDAQ